MGVRCAGLWSAARWLSKAVSVTLVVAVLCFLMVEAMPGDAALQVAAARYDIERVSSDVAAGVRDELGLERPALERLAQWLAALAQGELGRSSVTGQPVADVLAAPLWRTLALVALAWPASILLGIGLGLTLARSRGCLLLAQTLGAIASGTPTYVVGLVLALVVAVQWRLLPAAGYGGLAFVFLPAAALALRGAMRIALVTAVSAAQAAAHPSIAFARMKGLPETDVVLRHKLPLAAPPIIAFVFVSLAGLLEGVAVIEIVFAYPGLGKLLVDAVVARDVPVLQAVALVIALMVVGCNACADLLARRLDPWAAP